MSTSDPSGNATAGFGPPPGYGQPGYPHPYPAYGPPGYPPGYPPAFYRPPTNSMAVLALVLALTVAPAGLIVGIIARRQIRRTGEAGAGLALAGIVVGAIGTAIFGLLILVWIVALVLFTNGY